MSANQGRNHVDYHSIDELHLRLFSESLLGNDMRVYYALKRVVLKTLIVVGFRFCLSFALGFILSLALGFDLASFWPRFSLALGITLGFFFDCVLGLFLVA